MKYIINTGCSYGVMFRSFREFTKGNDNNFRIIDLHCDSTGSDYAKRSIIYTVSKLIKKGISTKDIYVIVEWSQPNRLHIELPKEFCNEIINDKIHTLEDTFVLNNKFNKINFDISFVKKYKSLSTIFNDRVYANIEHLNLDSFKNKNLIFYIKKFIENSHISNKPIDRLENYLTNILDLQSFLKSKQIEHSFFLMNNTFEGYLENFSNFMFSESTINLLKFNKIELPNLKSHMHIKDFSDYLKNLWNQIDLSNFHFYKTNNFKYGGIDEYSMEKFGHISYLSAANEWDIPTDGSNVTSFGAHPHDSVYVSFFEEYIYPRTKHFFGILDFDYENRWCKSKMNSIRK